MNTLTLEDEMVWTESTDDTSVLYDVCNDYSLDRDASTDAGFEASKYVWRKADARSLDGRGLMEGVVGIHKGHNEVHYWRGPAGMNGAMLFTDGMAVVDLLYP
jgi:hypothetical protein